jgi:putative flippase GtrA
MFASVRLSHQTEVRFVMVGIWNTIFSYIVFVALDWIFTIYFSPRYVAYLLAAILSNIISVNIAYFLHRNITYKSKARGMAAFREYIRFYTTYIFTLILSIFLLPIFVELIGLSPKTAAAIIMSLLAIFSYVSHTRFTFRRL